MQNNDERVFIAINLPEEAKNEIEFFLAKLKKKVGYVTWSSPENMHITLQFLGNLGLEKIDELCSALNTLENKYNSEMEFKLGKLNAFPNIFNAKIIYLEARQQTGTSVMKLYKEILDELIKLDLEIDMRKWFSHITLGRAKSKIDSNIFERFNLEVEIKFKIKSFELMESILTPSGPIYKVIRSFNL